MNQTVTERHNPDFRLVGKQVQFANNYIEFVYGVDNKGKNEGLEAYLYKYDTRYGHYRSYRWSFEKTPKKYKEIFNELKALINNVPNGHKLSVN